MKPNPFADKQKFACSADPPIVDASAIGFGGRTLPKRGSLRTTIISSMT